MDHRSQFPTPKKSRRNRRRPSLALIPPSIFFFLLLVSHLVATTTVVVVATDVADGGENGIGSTTIEEINESGDEITIEDARSIGTTGNEVTDNTLGDAGNKTSDHSSNSEEILEEVDISQENKSQEVIDGIDTLEGDNVAEDVSSSSSQENDKKENIHTPLDENETEVENTIDSLTENETDHQGSQEASAMGNDTTTSELEKEEKDIPPISSSSPNEESEKEIRNTNLGDEIEPQEPSLDSEEKSNASPSSSSDESAESQHEAIETEDEQIQENHSQDSTKRVEDTKEGEGQQGTPNNDATQSDTPPTTKNDEDNQDDNSTTEEDPVDDNGNANDDSHIDLDSDPEVLKTGAAEEENDNGKEDDENHVQSEVTEEKDSSNTTASEVPTAVTADSYRGEPWGQYRSTRRLPDLELLRLVFENSNKTKRNGATHDAKSKTIVDSWQKDPLYDENIKVDERSREPPLLDEQDQKFRDYRSRLLGENDDGASRVNVNDEPNAENDKPKEEIDGNQKSNDSIADVNSEFVEGLDDINKFFEGVNPPDELDVGYGSSIQDVLMDKGKHILLKKVRGAARWIKIGWQTMSRELEERISQFQLPFQKTEASSDFDVAEVDSTNSILSSEQREQIVKTIREGAKTAWKIGKQTFELISDLVDGLLDRLDNRSEDESANFDDFGGFDLDNLSTFSPPK